MAVFTNENSSVRFVHGRRRDVFWELLHVFPSDLVRDENSDQEEWMYVSAWPWRSRSDEEYRYIVASKESVVACGAKY